LTTLNGWRAHGSSQNLKGSYEKVTVVSVEQILRQEGSWSIHGWKIEKYILDIVLPLDTQKKYKLADLKPLISFGVCGSNHLANAAKCYALYKTWLCNPEDVRAVVHHDAS
jgi:MoxR-like ATPase